MNTPLAIVLGENELELLYAVSVHLAKSEALRTWLRAQRNFPLQEMPSEFAEEVVLALREEIRKGADLTLARRAEMLDRRLMKAFVKRAGE